MRAGICKFGPLHSQSIGYNEQNAQNLEEAAPLHIDCPLFYSIIFDNCITITTAQATTRSRHSQSSELCYVDELQIYLQRSAQSLETAEKQLHNLLFLAGGLDHEIIDMVKPIKVLNERMYCFSELSQTSACQHLPEHVHNEAELDA
jgi:hypothetical protein